MATLVASVAVACWELRLLSGKELVVNCTCVVVESANDALNSFKTFCGERSAIGIDMG